MQLPTGSVINRGRVEQLEAWFDEQAAAIHAGATGHRLTDALHLLSHEGLLGTGVPPALGGEGGSLRDAVFAIAAVSERCLTSGFVFWCQRALAELLVASGNPWLRATVLPRILSGECSGATGLADAVKHLPAAPDRLRVRATLADDGRLRLAGTIPWASNLRPDGFVLAVAAQAGQGRSVVAAVPSSAAGVARGPDQRLLGLQASWTAGVRLQNVELSREWMISDDAAAFLPRVRSAFILLQCGLSLGLARRSVAESLSTPAGRGRILKPRIDAAAAELRQFEATLASLAVHAGDDVGRSAAVLAVRVGLTRLAVRAVQLELDAAGSAAYLESSGTARRVREAAFLPLLSPTLVQLEAELTGPAVDGQSGVTS